MGRLQNFEGDYYLCGYSVDNNILISIFDELGLKYVCTDVTEYIYKKELKFKPVLCDTDLTKVVITPLIGGIPCKPIEFSAEILHDCSSEDDIEYAENASSIKYLSAKGTTVTIDVPSVQREIILEKEIVNKLKLLIKDSQKEISPEQYIAMLVNQAYEIMQDSQGK